MDKTQLKKPELVAYVEELEEYINDLEETLVYVQDRKVVEVKTVEIKKPGRKDEVLAILKRGKPVSVAQLAKEIGINERNISSQLTYLRKDGHRIATDSRGLKFLEK